MRKLAILAFSFSGAVFAAARLLPENWLPAGAVAAGFLFLALLVFRRGLGDSGLALRLVCAGCALGLAWTAAYIQIFFQPARELDGQTVLLCAEAADWPQEGDYGWSVLVKLKTDRGISLSTVLYLDEQGSQVKPGDRLSTVAHCTLGDRTLTGEEITYYTAKGIFLRAHAYGRLDIQRPERVPIRYWSALLSKELKAGISAAFPKDTAPLIQALVTGNRDGLTDQFTTSLQRTGLSHTVAVSGMHLAFLSGLLTLLLGRGKRSTAVANLVWAVLFCGIAGNTPSVLRAAVMISMLQLAPLFRRERDGATALGLALMGLLAWNPFSAAHLGLQLSFGAVAGILLVSDRIQNGMRRLLRLEGPRKSPVTRLLLVVPDFLVSTLSATLGASLLTVPLVAVYFGYLSLIAPLANLLTLWAVAVLFVAGLWLGVFGVILPGAAAVMAIPFTALARYLDWVVDGLSSLSLAALPMDSFYYRAWVVFLYLMLGAALLIRGKKRILVPLCAGAATLAFCLLCSALAFRAGELTAAVLDVGQGQSVLLRTGDYLTLVDCGGEGQRDPGDVAADYIQAQGMARLDLLVVSHYHTDHANGIPQLLRRIPVGTIALPDVEEGDPLREEIIALAQERGIELYFIRRDTNFDLGEGRSIEIFPPVGQGGQTNELGLTVLASSGGFAALITGDMSGESEKELLAHADLPDIDLLVAGHHGSRDSTTGELLERVRPELAVISAGKGNSYGHPAPETLERLDGVGALIYRTDLQGTVVVRADGHAPAEG